VPDRLNPPAPSIAVGSLGAAEVLRHSRDITSVYAAVFSGPPYRESPENVRGFRARLQSDTALDGFRFVVAQVGATPVGFAYGYASKPGQWWHEMVRRALGPDQAAVWLVDAFEFVELALLPANRGQGLGARLYDALFQGLPHQTALASTADLETDAMRLYRRRGWVVLRGGFVFPRSTLPYVILGLDLRPSTAPD
jgi:GNAT superfamily N-acetyltransferase